MVIAEARCPAPSEPSGPSSPTVVAPGPSTLVGEDEMWPDHVMGPDTTADALFESSARGVREVGASVADRDLVALISRHGREEAARLERYEALADEASPAMRYLVELVVEDERRHHRLLAEIADAIAWGTVEHQGTPVPRAGTAGADAALVREAKALLASEKADRRELRRLRRHLRHFTGTLWPLLVDVMLCDTNKHVRILEFVADLDGR